MPEFTDLQRDILVVAYNNPRLTQTEIAAEVDCSASYVSNVLNRYDSRDAFQAELEQTTTISSPSFQTSDPAWAQGSWGAGDGTAGTSAIDDADIGLALENGIESAKVLAGKESSRDVTTGEAIVDVAQGVFVLLVLLVVVIYTAQIVLI